VDQAHPVEQAKQVEALADAAHEEWESYRRGLGSFAKIYVATALDDKLETAITAGVPASAGLSSLGLASVGIGVAVGVLTVASKTAKKLVQRRKTDPYRYLSRLMAHGATMVADIADD
jgi:galactokinase